MGVLEARLEHCCRAASSSPGLSRPPSTSCASRPALARVRLGIRVGPGMRVGLGMRVGVSGEW